jgi:hypothetical protein
MNSEADVGSMQETFEPRWPRERGTGPGPRGRGSVVSIAEEEEPTCSGRDTMGDQDKVGREGGSKFSSSCC